MTSVYMGYLDYRDEQRAGLQYAIRTASTFGTGLTFGYDFGINEHITFGVATSLVSGLLNKIEVNENGTTRTINLRDTVGDPEGFASINVSGGLKFHF